jgi:CRISPR-associated protein (TIGR02584 family)
MTSSSNLFYPRRILLAVTGLSPQVVTETLYALVQDSNRILPTEVHILTTEEGAERARLTLLSEDPGWFHRLCRDYELESIDFDAHSIHILTDRRGQPLSDIRTLKDNQQAADVITEHVRMFTADSESCLHVSIAGGRKTMGFYAGYALSLFGRPQDRLSHVLVSPPYESHPDFFYPTPSTRVIYTPGPDSRPLDTRQAKVTLAEIPFVSLRHGIPEALLAGRASFRATVEAAQISLGPVRLILDVRSSLVQAADKIFRLPPAQFAMLVAFAHRLRASLPPMRAPLKEVQDREWAADYLQNLRSAYGLHLPDSIAEALEKGVDESYFSQHLSRLRRRLRDELGLAATPYLIDGGNTRPRRYRLALAPQAIHFAALSIGEENAGKLAEPPLLNGAYDNAGIFRLNRKEN